jgi:uncharacterized protein
MLGRIGKTRFRLNNGGPTLEAWHPRRQLPCIGKPVCWYRETHDPIDREGGSAQLGYGNSFMDEGLLIEAVLRNRINKILLERLPRLGLADVWLVSGSVFQTVWNAITGRAPDYGIKDYDIFYFDADTSWDAEDATIRHVAAAVSDLDVLVEVRNQARVHLWYPSKFGIAYPPLRRATEGIDRFLAVAAQIGIRLTKGNYDVYAPRGLDDLLSLMVRPNLCSNFSTDFYEAKAAAWKARWPEVTVLHAVEMGRGHDTVT